MQLLRIHPLSKFLTGFILSVFWVAFYQVQAKEVVPSSFNIYAWQNWSFEKVNTDNRDYTRISNNAANIGFIAHVNSGIDGLQVGFRCEQFTFFNNLNDYTNLCNRNSKISLRHDKLGEIMFAQWLLPFNEIVAQWVDPFYDAGADSHTSIMGNFGYGAQSYFYNGGFADFNTANADFGQMSFNRRQQDIIQYVWPNTSDMASQTREGVQFRVAVTSGRNNDTTVTDTNDGRNQKIDPYIFSTGASYQTNIRGNGRIWIAVAYERHDDWSVGKVSSIDVQGNAGGNAILSGGFNNLSTCLGSEDEAFRVAARHTRDWDNGMSTTIAGMWEKADWQLDQCNTLASNANYSSVNIDRNAWMISGKHVMGNGFDLRASYMNASDLDLDLLGNATNTSLVGKLNNSNANAYNVGVFYTTPKGTEVRLTYSSVDNGSASAYDFGINGASYNGILPGEDINMVALGLVQWFD